MIVLITIMLIAMYFGIVISIIFRFNQCNVLKGRMLLVLLLPIMHFIMMPVNTIFVNNKQCTISERLHDSWIMILCFPIVLALYSAHLVALKELNKSNEINVYKKVYDKTFSDVSIAC